MSSAESPSTLADDLHWTEPDTGCVSCGQPYLTVDDHRCGECIGELVRHCPHCLADVSALIDREVVRRLRSASLDASQEWTQGRHFDRYRERERVLEARSPR